MDEHRCSLCFRCFSSGRALGGHMRSHVTAATPKHHRSHQCAAAVAGEEDDEGDSEYPHAHRSRSKRTRVSHSAVSPDPASSASDVTADEDVARCLMMLSRDFWATGGHESEGNGRQLSSRLRPPRRGRSKRPPRASGRISVDGGELFECPFCFRVFASGQALGGHKRSHLAAASSISATSPAPATRPPSTSTEGKCRNGLVSIDLNSPAAMEVEEEAVSDHTVGLYFILRGSKQPN